METKFTATRNPSLNLNAARTRARLARQLAFTSGRTATQFTAGSSLYNSLWSPVRLDLLKTPLTRYRE